MAADSVADDRPYLEDVMVYKANRIPFGNRLFLLTLMIFFASCNRSSEKTFASPEVAGSALMAAATSGDRNQLLEIFGPDSKDIIFSGDPVQDKIIVDKFVAAYGVMHRWRKASDSSQILLVGADNFPFPIPLEQNARGQWFFDTKAGKQEVLARRIGRNELAVMDVCRGVADAQAEYFSQLHDGDPTHQYAMKFISDPGTQNGLYWQSSEGQPQSPLGPMVALATGEGYAAKANQRQPFHGYYFRMLKGQTQNAPGGAKSYVVDGKMSGGFAFIAYPAEYRNSGVMTFAIDQDGVLMQKDLGKKTGFVAATMTEFDPKGWTPVGQ